MPNTAVQIIDDTKSSLKVAGYGVVFGGQDVVGDFFTASTDFWADDASRTPPVLYQHGQDDSLKRARVGKVTSVTADDTGLWVEAQLNASSKYLDAIRHLVQKGVLGWSSGSVGHLVDRVKHADGRKEITSWPIFEFSLTPTPAEPRTIGVRAMKSLGIELPTDDYEIVDEDDTKAQQGLARSDYAWVDSDGTGHLDISDEGHVRAAMARFNQTHFTEPGAKRAAARKIIARARSMGIDVDPDSTVAQAAKGVAMDEGQPEFTGSAMKMADWSARLAELAQVHQNDQIAMKRFKIDTKDGHRYYEETRAVLEQIVDEMVHDLAWAKSIDEGEDGIRRVNYYKHRLALLALEAS